MRQEAGLALFHASALVADDDGGLDGRRDGVFERSKGVEIVVCRPLEGLAGPAKTIENLLLVVHVKLPKATGYMAEIDFAAE